LVFFPISGHPRRYKNGRHQKGRRKSELRAVQGRRDRNRPAAAAGGSVRLIGRDDDRETTATIDTARSCAILIVYKCVPKAPTVQTGEKFGAMPAAFKMRDPGPARYRIKCKKLAEI
jgi:hypothetical protein